MRSYCTKHQSYASHGACFLVSMPTSVQGFQYSISRSSTSPTGTLMLLTTSEPPHNLTQHCVGPFGAKSPLSFGARLPVSRGSGSESCCARTRSTQQSIKSDLVRMPRRLSLAIRWRVTVTKEAKPLLHFQHHDVRLDFWNLSWKLQGIGRKCSNCPEQLSCERRYCGGYKKITKQVSLSRIA